MRWHDVLAWVEFGFSSMSEIFSSIRPGIRFSTRHLNQRDKCFMARVSVKEKMAPAACSRPEAINRSKPKDNQLDLRTRGTDP